MKVLQALVAFFLNKVFKLEPITEGQNLVLCMKGHLLAVRPCMARTKKVAGETHAGYEGRDDLGPEAAKQAGRAERETESSPNQVGRREFRRIKRRGRGCQTSGQIGWHPLKQGLDSDFLLVNRQDLPALLQQENRFGANATAKIDCRTWRLIAP
jgi:hypothetical protein